MSVNVLSLNLLTICILDTLNGYFTNSVAPDEMQRYAAFYQDLFVKVKKDLHVSQFF